jgi:hypothetical protein
MKFYIKVFAVVATIILVVLLLQEFGDEGGGRTPASSSSSGVATAAPAAATPAAVVTAVPVAAAPVAAAPVARAQSAPSIPPFITQAANGAHVTLTKAEPVNDWWYITVVGRDRNALNDFLDTAMRLGLRDVDVNYQAYKEFLVRGEQRSQNTYKMRF